MLTIPCVPSWAKVLIDCFKALNDERKCVSKLVESIQKLESLNEVQKTVTDNLEVENKKLNRDLAELMKHCDEQEQRGRNYCLLFHGVEEKDNEDTDNLVLGIINTNLGVKLSLDDIQRSHRLGPKTNKRTTRSAKASTCPIIFKFSNYPKRQEVFKAKRKLKGLNIYLSENLPLKRYELYQASIKKFGRGEVWTIKGRVAMKGVSGYVTLNVSGK